MSKKKLTLADLLAEPKDAPLWVLNTSATTAAGQTAEVIIPIRTAKGDNTRVVVECTWLPTELTGQIPRTDLLADTNFRKAIQNGLIQPVGTEWAQTETHSNDAKEEIKRLDAKARSVQEAVAFASEDSETVQAEATEQKPSKPGVTQEYENWVARVSQLTDGAIQNEIRLRRRFTFKELRLLLRKIGDKPAAREQINAMIAKKKSRKSA